MSQYHVYLLWVGACLVWCLNSVLNVKRVVGAFNQEKALVASRGLLCDCEIFADVCLQL